MIRKAYNAINVTKAPSNKLKTFQTKTLNQTQC